MSSLAPVRNRPGHHLAWFHDDGRFFRKDPQPEKPAVFRLFQVGSTDGGLTWGQPRELFASAEVNLCEPGWVRSPDGGEIALLLRENRRVKRSHVMFSRDEGQTWTPPKSCRRRCAATGMSPDTVPTGDSSYRSGTRRRTPRRRATGSDGSVGTRNSSPRSRGRGRSGCALATTITPGIAPTRASRSSRTARSW